jgi:hypothetical protein
MVLRFIVGFRLRLRPLEDIYRNLRLNIAPKLPSSLKQKPEIISVQRIFETL